MFYHVTVTRGPHSRTFLKCSNLPETCKKYVHAMALDAQIHAQNHQKWYFNFMAFECFDHV